MSVNTLSDLDLLRLPAYSAYPSTDIGDGFGTVPELASLFGDDAFRDLGAQLFALRSEELLALAQETQGLADDLVHRLEETGLELSSHDARTPRALAQNVRLIATHVAADQPSGGRG